MDFHLTVMFLLRWIHILTGILWVGFAFFFNFVLTPAARRMDPDSRKKIMPDLLDRALFWFRWSALVTYITGWVYIIWKCYIASNVGFHGENGFGNTSWGQWISVGVIIGTVLILNVWFVIWPAQKKLIGWMRAGQTPAEMPKLAARVEHIAKINAYLSAPLIFSMAAASHLPMISPWIIIGSFVAGFALVAHFFLISKKLT
jgi:uncharacterized membrane protein